MKPWHAFAMQVSSKLHSAAQLFSRRSGTATLCFACRTQPQPHAMLPLQLISHCAAALQVAEPFGPPPPHTEPR